VEVPVESLAMFLKHHRKKRERVSVLSAGPHCVTLLRRNSLVIQKRGMSKVVLVNIRDYVRLAAPEPQVLRLIEEESQRRDKDALTSGQIDRIIVAARKCKR
jgi:predicted component of type VI protein secretion system